MILVAISFIVGTIMGAYIWAGVKCVELQRHEKRMQSIVEEIEKWLKGRR